MSKINLPAMLCISLLAGCQQYTVPANAPQSLTSNYGAASSVAVTRHAQYQMWDRGIIGSHKNEAVTRSLPVLHANSDSLSFDWDGDAIELLNTLAQARGLQFNYSGVRLPLPVSIHVRNMTFRNALRIVEAQTAWRASINQYPGLLQLTFMKPESARK